MPALRWLNCKLWCIADTDEEFKELAGVYIYYSSPYYCREDMLIHRSYFQLSSSDCIWCMCVQMEMTSSACWQSHADFNCICYIGSPHPDLIPMTLSQTGRVKTLSGGCALVWVRRRLSTNHSLSHEILSNYIPNRAGGVLFISGMLGIGPLP